MEGQHAHLAAIDLRSPSDKLRYGFIIRTMVFGAVSAVLHYNVFSRAISEIPTNLVGSPLLCLFDDFGAIVPDGISEISLQKFSSPGPIWAPNWRLGNQNSAVW